MDRSSPTASGRNRRIDSSLSHSWDARTVFFFHGWCACSLIWFFCGGFSDSPFGDWGLNSRPCLPRVHPAHLSMSSSSSTMTTSTTTVFFLPPASLPPQTEIVRFLWRPSLGRRRWCLPRVESTQLFVRLLASFELRARKSEKVRDYCHGGRRRQTDK